MRALVTFRRLCCVLSLGAFLHLSAPSALAQGQDPVLRARALLEAKDAAAAYRLLEPLEAQRAQDAAFSYWFGVAALESGQLERAALAFERTLALNPEQDGARAALGRSYLRMGALDLAEREFELLADRPMDATGKKAVQAYLAEIRGLKARSRFRVTAFAEAGGGHDSNITATTRDFTSAVQGGFGLPGINPSGNSIRRADTFTSLEAGADLAWRPREDRTLFASVSGRARNYRDYGDFDYRLFEANAGVQMRAGENSHLVAVFGQDFRQEGAAGDGLLLGLTNDRRAAGVQLEFRRSASASTEFSFGAQASALRFPDNPGQDSNQYQLSFGVQHAPAAWRQSSLAAVAYVTVDDAVRPLNEFTTATAAHRTYGFRITAQSNPRAALSWAAGAGVSRRVDDDEFARATLVAVGRDTLAEVFAKLNWRFTDRWSASLWAAYLNNRSNIELYSFRKAEGGVNLRFDYQ